METSITSNIAWQAFNVNYTSEKYDNVNFNLSDLRIGCTLGLPQRRRPVDDARTGGYIARLPLLRAQCLV
jgi:hypothetical protein